MQRNPQENPNDTEEEIDVTEIVERLDSLEKTRDSLQLTLDSLLSRVQDCEDTIDAIASR